jgi:hypothetical protein
MIVNVSLRLLYLISIGFLADTARPPPASTDVELLVLRHEVAALCNQPEAPPELG